MAQKRMMIGDDFLRQGTPENPCPDDAGKITSMLAHAKNWLDLDPPWEERGEGGDFDWYYLADILDAIITKIHQLDK